MNYKILSEETVFDAHFKIKKAKIEHDSFVDAQPVEVNRLCFERGDSVAILLHEIDTDTILFTNQFRYPSIKDGDGWILELTAGSIEEGEEPANCANREIEEEIGYSTGGLNFISSFFVSPGGCSERIFLFAAEVNSSDKIYKGGGVDSESEDIQLIKIHRTDIQSMLQNNQFRDAKTIIGLQWFLANTSAE